MELYVCEFGFTDPDRDKPNYSQLEVDFYAWVHPKPGLSNHRLSLRKNLTTGQFELYRHYEVQVTRRFQLATGEGGVLVQNQGLGKDQVIFSSASLAAALRLADEECVNAGHGPMGDKVCEHEYPRCDRTFCPKVNPR